MADKLRQSPKPSSLFYLRTHYPQQLSCKTFALCRLDYHCYYHLQGHCCYNCFYHSDHVCPLRQLFGTKVQIVFHLSRSNQCWCQHPSCYLCGWHLNLQTQMVDFEMSVSGQIGLYHFLLLHSNHSMRISRFQLVQLHY